MDLKELFEEFFGVLVKRHGKDNVNFADANIYCCEEIPAYLYFQFDKGVYRSLEDYYNDPDYKGYYVGIIDEPDENTAFFVGVWKSDPRLEIVREKYIGWEFKEHPNYYKGKWVKGTYVEKL